VIRYKKSQQPAREIGRTLASRISSRQRATSAAHRVRISAQLIDTDTDENIWAETYDRDMTDIFAIQSRGGGAIRRTHAERE
jgi:TolB-like protein